jgi:hypothetical protein
MEAERTKRFYAAWDQRATMNVVAHCLPSSSPIWKSNKRGSVDV